MSDIISKALAKSNQTKIGDLSQLDWLPANIVQSVKDLRKWVDQRAINLRQPPYNAPANNVDDDSAILQKAIDDMFATSQQLNGVGGKAYYLPKIILPNGQYVFNNTVTYNPVLPTSHMGDAVSLCIEGAGYGSSLRIGTANTMFDFTKGTVHISNLRMLGDAGKTGFVLGRNTLDGNGGFVVVSQSTFTRVNMTYWEKNFDIGHAYDTSFYECGFFSAKGTNPVTFNIQAHTGDNTNNLQFYRCHWEAAVNTTFFKAKGISGSVTVHNNFGFHGCHFETRSFNTTVLDLEYVTRVKFTTTQFSRNNVPNGQNAGVTEANTTPLFKLKDINGLNFDTCTLGHVGSNGTSPLVNALFDLGGVISGVSFQNSMISTGVNIANQGINAIWQANATNPPTFPDGVFAKFDGTTHIDDRNSVGAFGNMVVSASMTQRNKKWFKKYNETTNDWETFYDNTANGFGSGTPLSKESTDGMFKYTSLGAGFMQTVVNGATATYSPSFNNNANKRGMYRVMADYSGDAFALFFSTGAAVYPIFVGSACTLATTNTNTAGKLNIYLSGTSIAINNQLGSDRRVSIGVEGFY